MTAVSSLLSDSADIAIWAMMAASILPFIFALLAKIMGKFNLKDNADPRAALAKVTGRAARANAAQQNSFESLPIFLAAVLVAMLFFVPQTAINNLAVLYVLIRIAYGMAYILNLPTFRSILWALSIACCLMLFYLPIRLSF